LEAEGLGANRPAIFSDTAGAVSEKINKPNFHSTKLLSSAFFPFSLLFSRIVY